MVAPRHPALPIVNPQLHAATQLSHIPDPAARMRAALAWADAQRQDLLQNGRSFITETTFSNPARVALLAQARTLGFEVVLYGLSLDEPELLLQRVAQRALKGGHPVPPHTVLESHARCVGNLRQAVSLAQLALLLDAADAYEGGPRLIASVMTDQMQLHTMLRPRWVEKVLGFAEG